MVGNDVVDLGDPETRADACHRRFDDRVFTDRERCRLDAAADRRRLRWRMWAAKESAFKLARRRDARVIFSPPAFEVVEVAGGGSMVCHAGHCYQLSIRVLGDAVHAVCTDDPVDAGCLLTGVALAPPELSPSVAVRSLATALLGRRLAVAPDRLKIVLDAQRIPRLCASDREPPFHLSLSHHGRYVACACWIA